MKTITFISFVLLLILPTNYNFAQWQPTGMTTGGVSHIASNSTAIIANNSGLKYSSDGGNNWISMNYFSTMALTANEEAVFAAGSSQSQVSKTTNLGINWTHYSVSAADGIFSLHTSGNNVYAGAIHYGVRRSKDNGSSWGVVSFPFGTVNSIFAIGSNVYTALEDWGLSVSTNNGVNWSSLYLNQEFVNIVHSNGSHVFAGTKTGGIFISSDNGSSWNQSALNNINVTAITSSGNNIFAGSTNSGVYFSGNNGTSWQQVNTGLTNLNIRALHVHGEFIYAGTVGAGLWKRPLSEVLGLQNISAEVPDEYSLHQNYPNPFNPSTRIKFSIPVDGYTSLKIYDVNGSLVSTLAATELSRGTYEADFNASGIASGIYYYQLNSGNFTKTHKMILVK